MKRLKLKYLVAIIVVNCLFAFNVQSQTNLAGDYTDTGYFFHPTSPRKLASLKNIKQVNVNTYEVYLGDLGGLGGLSQTYSFQFQLDSKNNLINWTPVNFTPSVPESGFMTLDNPGKIAFTVTPLPGQYPYQQAI